MSDFLTSPHVQNSRNLVHFVCFLGTPPPSSADVICGSPILLCEHTVWPRWNGCFTHVTPASLNLPGGLIDGKDARNARNLPIFSVTRTIYILCRSTNVVKGSSFFEKHFRNVGDGSGQRRSGHEHLGPPPRPIRTPRPLRRHHHGQQQKVKNIDLFLVCEGWITGWHVRFMNSFCWQHIWSCVLV